LSTITHSAFQNCPNCGAELPLEALACPQCQALIQSVRLDQLAKDARALEVRGLFPQARELWTHSLTLLPENSQQSGWVHERLRALEQVEAGIVSQTGKPLPGPLGSQPQSAPAPPGEKPPPPSWVKRLGPFGPLALFLLKFKTLFIFLLKFKFLFSFLIFIWLYVTLFGWRFGVGFCVCILIHEMGHYIDIRRRGLPAEMPIFLPGFGAYVRWTGLGVTIRQIAQISLAGPLAGWIASAVCFLIYAQTQDPIWAALARTSAFLNVLNLIPVWFLDGGLACHTLGTTERAGLLALSLGLWYYTGEGIFVFVALGAVWRIFTAMTHREPVLERSDWGSWAYYAAVLIALAVILHAAPNTLAQQGMEAR
jgi:Zn-dependent protease